jgi:hypothetical protein
MSDAQRATLKHGDRSGAAFWLSQAGQFSDRAEDRGCGLIGEAQDHAARVAARRIGADAGEPSV